ncbi:MAG: heme o synthase [Saprospiraceae bacterium]
MNNNNKTYVSTYTERGSFGAVLLDYVMLVKLKLSLVVVMSSVLGYVIAAGAFISLFDVFRLIAGGLLVTGAANTFNQVLEKDFDIMMTRTANRPIATGRLKTSDGVLFGGIMCLIGISILATFNPLTALIGMLSLILYAFVYTPLKRYSTIAVAVGAIPGALPVLIGATAFDGRLSLMAVCLFIIQFLWQFPHFWSIGFLGYEDYQKAGFKLLPERLGKIDRNLGMSSLFYAFLILPLIAFMAIRLDVSLWSTAIVLLLTFGYMGLSFHFHKKFDRAAAMKLMFYSFFYLPFVLLAYWLL